MQERIDKLENEVSELKAMVWQLESPSAKSDGAQPVAAAVEAQPVPSAVCAILRFVKPGKCSLGLE